jgi:hypothetical protein
MPETNAAGTELSFLAWVDTSADPPGKISLARLSKEVSPTAPHRGAES